MTIRSRLFALLLPPLIAFVTIISLFFYLNWRNEIINSFKLRLMSTAISIATTLPTETVKELKEHPSQNKQLTQDFNEIMEQVGLYSIYLVHLTPVKKGEPVLLNQPTSDDNPAYEGKNPAYAFRQVYLMDASSQKPRQPGELDFSESDEHLVYITKQPIITDKYESRIYHEHIITAYAPVMDNNGEVIALLGVDVAIDTVDQKLKAAAIVITLSAIATLLLVLLCVYISAQRISKPIVEMKAAALDIAAGEYGNTIAVHGPKEVTELANTLNTMSECLKENIDRFKQSAAARERLYGEYECAQLMQERMFKKSFTEFTHPHWQALGLQTQESQALHGIYASFETKNDGTVNFEMIENPRQGFEGLYELLQSVGNPTCLYPCIHLTLKDNGKAHFQCKDFPTPILWKDQQIHFFNETSQELTLTQKDILLVATPLLYTILNGQKGVEQWLARVLKHFSQDSLELTSSMLQQELIFLTDSHHLERDIFMGIFKSLIN